MKDEKVTPTEANPEVVVVEPSKGTKIAAFVASNAVAFVITMVASAIAARAGQEVRNLIVPEPKTEKE
jgi:hypothetical protein